MWQLAGNTASLEFPEFSLSIDLESDSRKVLIQRARGESLAELWNLHSPGFQGSAPLEAYLRDNDLVAKYAPTDSFPFFTELYWTLRTSAEPCAALSLLVSVRTDLLDTHPEVEVTTRLPGSPSLVEREVAGGRMFWRRVSDALTLVDFATDDECAEQSLTGAGPAHIHRRLFAHFMEKGVIRRARLFAALAPATITEPQAIALCEEFAAAELPLTT